MTTISLHTAVLLAIQEVFTSRQSFSAHDITKLVRSHVNDGTYQLSDRDSEDVDGVETQRVEHTEVRGIIDEWFDSGVLAGGNISRRFNGSFNEYARNNVGQAPVTPVQQPVPPVAQTSTNNPVIAALKDYLKRRGPTTLKQIQSRFKGTSLTCGDLSKLVQNQHDLALKSNPVLSRSVVFLA